MRTIITSFTVCLSMLAGAFAAEVSGSVSASGNPPPKHAAYTLVSPGSRPGLDEKTYENRIIHYLDDKGLIYAPGDPNAIKLTYAYSIDKGRPMTVAQPVYGPTGFNSFYIGGGGGYRHHHHGGGGVFIGGPSYGVVGAVPQTIVVYNRELVLTFLSPHGGNPLYQIKYDSAGPEGDINYVLPAMIHAAIKRFPMEPGRRADVSADIE